MLRWVLDLEIDRVYERGHITHCVEQFDSLGRIQNVVSPEPVLAEGGDEHAKQPEPQPAGTEGGAARNTEGGAATNPSTTRREPETRKRKLPAQLRTHVPCSNDAVLLPITRLCPTVHRMSEASAPQKQLINGDGGKLDGTRQDGDRIIQHFEIWAVIGLSSKAQTTW